jgi:chromatin segregation and condensation protein Rec8/ScpA/Scc1 (kleisin family)
MKKKAGGGEDSMKKQKQKRKKGRYVGEVDRFIPEEEDKTRQKYTTVRVPRRTAKKLKQKEEEEDMESEEYDKIGALSGLYSEESVNSTHWIDEKVKEMLDHENASEEIILRYGGGN